MNPHISEALRLLPEYLTHHIVLVVSAMLLALLIGLPLVVACTRFTRFKNFILGAITVIQTIPGLALLALFYPILLGLSHLSERLFSFSFAALGFLPSVMALGLYALLPIVRNGVIGIDSIDRLVIEAADGVGMTARQKLVRIELPIAFPVLMAGIRLSAVWTIGTATLSTSIGQVSLGNYIYTGLQTENWILVLFGCVVVSLLSLLTDFILGLTEKKLSRRNSILLLSIFLVCTFGFVAAIHIYKTKPATQYVIGAKNFSEQFILAQLIQNKLAHANIDSRQETSLGSAVIFRALTANDIDVYVDYTGTIWTNILGRSDRPARLQMLEILSAELKKKYGITMLGSLGFENAYVLAVKRSNSFNVSLMSDLKKAAPKLRLGTDLEFLNRQEWKDLQKAYQLNFLSETSFSPTFMYQALESEMVDVISAFSSDGRIKAQDLLLIDDVNQVTPSYDAVILLAPKHSENSALRNVLLPLVNSLSLAKMQEANFLVDRTDHKLTIRQAAQFLEDKN
jgi:osmoprotectant transport system permease protein